MSVSFVYNIVLLVNTGTIISMFDLSAILVDKSNRPIIVTVLTIIVALLTNQTDLL
jgi:hypothetical protein